MSKSYQNDDLYKLCRAPFPIIMLHAKFRNHRLSLVLKILKKIFKVFAIHSHGDHLGSCELDHLYKVSFPIPKDAPH